MIKNFYVQVIHDIVKEKCLDKKLRLVNKKFELFQMNHVSNSF